MTRFESDIRTIPHSAEKVYNVLSDFDNFEDVVKSEKISNWQSFGDSCRFELTGLGEIGLKIVDTEPAKTIKYTADGQVPFNFFLWVQLKEIKDDETKLKLTIDAELNPMLKMVAKEPINKFLKMLADGIVNYEY
jgi:hypothetical protein